MNVSSSAARFLPDFETAGRRHSVPVALLLAVAQVESSYNPNATRAEAPRASLPPTPDFPQGGDKSFGLFQVLVRTARALGYKGEPAGLLAPALNADLGAALLRSNRRQYGDWPTAVAAYNGGAWGARRNAAGQFNTQGYVDKVTRALVAIDPVAAGDLGFVSRVAPASGDGLAGGVVAAFGLAGISAESFVVAGVVALVLILAWFFKRAP